jgi:hypothetical protein
MFEDSSSSGSEKSGSMSLCAPFTPDDEYPDSEENDATGGDF